MKLLNSLGPNPRMVRMFIQEKGLDIEFEDVDLWGAENRKEPYKRKNPSGQIPTLELDDGRCLAETVAICEYLDEIYPAPPLIGTNAWERAETRQAVRRVELQVSEYLYNSFRFGAGIEIFKTRFRCVPEAAEGLKAKGMDGVALINTLLDGKTYLCGERLTLADLILYSCLDFAVSAGMSMDPALTQVDAWFRRLASRPSASTSLSPSWENVKLRA